MLKSRIYNLAMYELLRQHEVEENRGDTISKGRLERLNQEINELHEMILETEKKGE